MTMQILRGFTLRVNDETNLALEIEEMKLAALEEITETFQPGGSDLEMEIAGLGVKALEVGFKLKTHNPAIVGLFGGDVGERHNFVGSKHIVDEIDGTTHEHSVDIKGRLAKVDAEQMKAGAANGYDYMIKSIITYTEYYDNRVVHRFNFETGGWDIRNYEAVNATRNSLLFG